MSDPIKIVVTAETEKAAAALQKVGATGTTSLRQLRETSLLAREGFHGLESIVLLLGGTRFPMLAQGIIGLRSGLMGLRTASLLTGISLSAMLPIIGGIAAAVGAGAGAWALIRGEQERARESANKLAEAYKEMPELIRRIHTAGEAGMISPSDQSRLLSRFGLGGTGGPASNAAYLAALMAPSTPAAYAQPGRISSSIGGVPAAADIKATNEELVKMGVLLKEVDEKGKATYTLNPQIEALDKIEELRKKMSVEAIDGYEKERAAVALKYEEEMAKLNELVETAGKKLKPEEATKLRVDLAAAMAEDLAEIDKKAAAEAIKCDEEELKQREADQRAYEERRKQMKKADLDAVVEQQQAARDALQEQKYTVGNDPFLLDSQKAAAIETIIQAQMRLASTERERLGYERELQQLMAQNTFSGAMVAQFVQFTNQLKTLQQNLASFVMSGFKGLQTGLASAIETLMEKGGNLKTFLTSVGKSIVTSMINSFARMASDFILQTIMMGIKWLALHTFMRGAMVQTAAVQQSVSATTQATDSTNLASGAAAGVGTAGSQGGAYGIVAYLIVLAAALAAVAAMTSHREAGGPVAAGSPYIVGEAGQELFVPDVSGHIVSNRNLSVMSNGSGSGGVHAGGGAAAGGGVSIKHLVVNDRQSLLNELKKSDAGHILVSHIYNNRRAAGIAT